MKTILVLFLLVFCSSSDSKTITLATLNWEPFYGKHLPENGYVSSISREAFRRAGYRLIIRFSPWKRAVEDAKSGYVDGLLGAYFSKTREALFMFTDPITASESVFVKPAHSHIQFGGDLSALKPYTIGILRGDAQTDILQAKGLRTEEVTNQYLNLQKLAAGRTDLGLISKQVYTFYLDQKLPKLSGRLEILYPVVSTKKIYNLISKNYKDHQSVIAGFNAALNEMKQDGTYEKIRQRFGF